MRDRMRDRMQDCMDTPHTREAKEKILPTTAHHTLMCTCCEVYGVQPQNHAELLCTQCAHPMCIGHHVYDIGTGDRCLCCVSQDSDYGEDVDKVKNTRIKAVKEAWDSLAPDAEVKTQHPDKQDEGLLRGCDDAVQKDKLMPIQAAAKKSNKMVVSMAQFEKMSQETDDANKVDTPEEHRSPVHDFEMSNCGLQEAQQSEKLIEFRHAAAFFAALKKSEET